MANSFVDIQVTGTASYSFSFPYLSEDHIKVYVGESLQALGTHYTFTNTYTIQFTAGNIPADTTQFIRIIRSTDEPVRLVEYSNTGLDASDLNLNSDQVFYMAQEAVDTIEIIEGIDIAGLIDKTTERYERSDFLGSGAYQTIGDRALFNPNLHGGSISSIVEVFLNGVLLKPTTVALDFSTGDYDTTSPSGLSISPVPAASDEITVVKTSAIPKETFDEVSALADSAALVTKVAHGGKSVKETFTATAGQTVINLANTYVQDINNVSVYVNGVRQSAYDETTTTSITLVNALAAGDELVVIINEYAVNQAGLDMSLVTYTPEGTGAVERTLGSKLGEAVSVKDFGAKLDGTDDTEAAQACIDATKGLYIPANTVLFVRTLTLPEDGFIIGSGKSSVIKQVANTTATLITSADPLTTKKVTLRDFALDGNSVNQTSANDAINIDNTGISAGTLSRNHFSNLLIRNVKGDGLVHPYPSRDSAYSNICIYKCDGIGFKVLGSDSTFSNINIGQSGRMGVYSEGASSNQYTNVKPWFSGRTISSDGYGFYFKNTNGNKLTNCFSQENEQDGFYFHGASAPITHTSALIYSDSDNKSGGSASGLRLSNVEGGEFDVAVYAKTYTQADGVLIQNGTAGCRVALRSEGQSSYALDGNDADIENNTIIYKDREWLRKLVYGFTTNIDPFRAEAISVDLTGDMNFNINTGRVYSGMALKIIFNQDSTGGRVVNFNAALKLDPANPTLVTTPDTTTVVDFICDGSRWIQTGFVTGL